MARLDTIGRLTGAVMLSVLPLRAESLQVDPIVPPRSFLKHATDYACLWWGYGLHGRSPEGHRVICLQTSRYALAFNVDTISFAGPVGLDRSEPEDAFMEGVPDAVFALPRASLEVTLGVAGDSYRLASLAPTLEDIRIIEHGRYLQRVEFHGLTFRNARGEALEGVAAHLELIAWPDRLALTLHVTPKEALRDPRATLALVPARPCSVNNAIPADVAGDVRALSQSEQGGMVVLRAAHGKWNEDAAGGAGLTTAPAAWWEGDRTETLTMVLAPVVGGGWSQLPAVVHDELEPFEELEIRARGIAPYVHPLEIAHDDAAGLYRIQLGRANDDGWTPHRDLDRLERVAVTLANDADRPRVLRLSFARDEKMEGLPGMIPMLRDRQGYPIGLPLQISKNWHDVYWFHASTMVHLPPHARADLEFTLAYAHWGGIPPVSHAQLCLVGWGGHQLWHEVAIGCFGEAICYDPEVGLNRSFIDDMRPLMVSSMGSRHWKDRRWGWTNNVGGCDFLVLENERGEHLPLSGVRCSYDRYGPALSEVRYRGRTSDRAVDADLTVRHARSDDIVRAFYKVRYVVRHELRFSRLAFFQLGADRYNDHQFRMLARGNREGVLEEWAAKWGELGYNREGIDCPGDQPWVATYAPIPKGPTDRPYDPELDGAWANRGFVVRGWRARLGGLEVPTPFVSEYRTNNGPPGIAIELAPPPGLSRLLPGDYIEADIELMIIPVHAGDYYGPNEALRKALAAHGDTWRMVWREAKDNLVTLAARRGNIAGLHPPVVDCDASGEAEIVVEGGVGFVPLTFRGVRDYRRPALERQTALGEWHRIDQSVHGNDFWQADYHPATHTWDLTFNINRDPDEHTLPRQAYRLRTGGVQAAAGG